MANQVNKREHIQIDTLKKPARRESFKTNSTNLDKCGEGNNCQNGSAKNESTNQMINHACCFLTNPRNRINDSLSRSLDEEITKQLNKKPKKFNWLKLNTNGQCKMLQVIKKGIVRIDATVLRFRDKLEHLMANEVELQQQFLVAVRFIDLADEHLLRMAKVNRNLKYNAWFMQVQQTKEKVLQISETRLLLNVRQLNETLLNIELDFSSVKDKIEQNLNDKNELKVYAKLVGQSSARIMSLKKNMDKEFRKLFSRLELKQSTLAKVHKFCISIIRLLDTLLPYFKKANCGCDLIVRTILVRKELAALANYA